MSEIAKKSDTMPAQEANAFVAMVQRIATDPNVDVEKMEKMLDMQERIINRNAMVAFNSAMAEMQSAIPIIKKSGAIEVNGKERSKYARFDDIMRIMKPILEQHGFAVSFRTKTGEGFVSVTGILMHKEGHREETEMMLPIDNSGSKNTVQAIGSSTAYGKRYVLCALLNIATGDEDDDGNMADLSELSEAINDIKSAETMDDLLAVFKRCWHSFTSPNDRARLSKAKDERKGELA